MPSLARTSIYVKNTCVLSINKSEKDSSRCSHTGSYDYRIARFMRNLAYVRPVFIYKYDLKVCFVWSHAYTTALRLVVISRGWVRGDVFSLGSSFFICFCRQKATIFFHSLKARVCLCDDEGGGTAAFW